MPGIRAARAASVHSARPGRLPNKRGFMNQLPSKPRAGRGIQERHQTPAALLPSLPTEPRGPSGGKPGIRIPEKRLRVCMELFCIE